MPGIKQRVTDRKELCKEICDLIDLRKYHYVKLSLPGSIEHERRVLPSDRIHLSAWRVKERIDKGKRNKDEEESQQ